MVAEFLNPLVRITAHYFTDSLTNSERVSRWYSREVDADYNMLREVVDFNLYEPEPGEIDYQTSSQVLLKGIAIVPASSRWWSGFINDLFDDLHIESELVDWMVLTNKELKQFRIDDGDSGKVGITFISINDGCTVLAEIDEDDLEELE